MMRPTLAALLLLALAVPGYAAETKEIHQLPFFIHQDLIDVPAGRDMSFYQDVIDQAIADANSALLGTQGPFDSPCSVEIVASGTPGASLISFSGASASPPQATGELLSIHFSNDNAAMRSIAGPGSAIFLVDFLENCSGSGLAIGCGSTPFTCDGNGNDDPNELTVITMDALVSGVLGQTLAHERGHNACLLHENTTDQCQIMRPAAGGGCLSSAECSDYQDGRNACLVLQGGSGTMCEVAVLSTINPANCVAASACDNASTLLGGNNALAECLASPTTVEADDLSCSEFGSAGFCSGGTCDLPNSPTGTKLLASADPDLVVFQDTLGSEVFDAQLTMSGRPGGWVNQGAWDNGDRPQGLAYAPARGVVYGVVPMAGDDDLIEIDPNTGATLARNTIPGRADIIALAWDPGPTASLNDDRLLGMDSNVEIKGIFESLIEIDPDDRSSNTLSGGFGCDGGFSGLAYDSVNDQLFVSSFCGLHLLECNPGCSLTTLTRDNFILPNGATLAGVGSGLAYSADTGNLYLVGNQVGIRLDLPPETDFRVTNYNVITGGSITSGPPGQSPGIDFVEVSETISLDGLSMGGLAAIPAPEPGSSLLLGAALSTLVGVARRKRSHCEFARVRSAWQATRSDRSEA